MSKDKLVLREYLFESVRFDFPKFPSTGDAFVIDSGSGNIDTYRKKGDNCTIAYRWTISFKSKLNKKSKAKVSLFVSIVGIFKIDKSVKDKEEQDLIVEKHARNILLPIIQKDTEAIFKHTQAINFRFPKIKVHKFDIRRIKAVRPR